MNLDHFQAAYAIFTLMPLGLFFFEASFESAKTEPQSQMWLQRLSALCFALLAAQVLIPAGTLLNWATQSLKGVAPNAVLGDLGALIEIAAYSLPQLSLLLIGASFIDSKVEGKDLSLSKAPRYVEISETGLPPCPADRPDAARTPLSRGLPIRFRASLRPDVCRGGRRE